MKMTKITISNNWLRIDDTEYVKTDAPPPAGLHWTPAASGTPIHTADRWARIVDSATGVTSSLYVRAVMP